MSRIGKKIISIPQGTEVKINDKHISVKGPKGTLDLNFPSCVTVKNENNEILVTVENPEDKTERSLWGTINRLISNMVYGTKNGFEKKLELVGIGFKAQVSGQKLTLNIGFSHPIEFPFSKDIEIKIEKNILTVSGRDKQAVGDVAAKIRKLKPPEPYKGTGIRYVGEIVKKKAGKKVSATSS
ncbi:MAG: 50S ribosomal protein L6 [Patescibacteria group bacterium]